MKKNKRRATIEILEYAVMYLGFLGMITMIIYNTLSN